jgi:hypothetical protein
MNCNDSASGWPLDPGTSVTPVAGRNHFISSFLPPFYSASRWAEQWVVASLAGPTQLHDGDGRLIAALGELGADIAVIDRACDGQRYLLGLRAGALEALTIDAGNRAVPAAEPRPIPGRLAALLPAGDRSSLTAVVHLAESNRHAAYRITVACGR